MITRIQVGDPEIVYHYTSAETLLKIVRSETPEIWATNLFYLNDASESSHSLKMFCKRLPAFLQRNKPQYGEALQNIFTLGVSIEQDPPFVASFSTLHDSLPQWRSYCPNGNGVSMGFRVSALRQSSVTHELILGRFAASKAKLDRVTYVGEGDDFRVDLILRKCLDELEEWKQSQAALPIEERTSIKDEEFLRYVVAEKACLVKHRSFESECEYRLTAPNDFFTKTDVIKFRSSRSTIIPYIPVKMPPWSRSTPVPEPEAEMAAGFEDYFLKEVIVGPTPVPELTLGALKLLFRRMGANVNVRPSDVTYRDL
jgi:hypothetical protein